MALGLRLRITNLRDNTTLERTFDRFPVRIGRNQLNDLQLDFPFVSQFHAVLELHGQNLMLRDLGSKNGTLLRGQGKVPANQLLDLAPTNYEFAIVNLIFNAFATNVEVQPPPVRKRQGTVLSMSVSDATSLDPRVLQPPARPGTAAIPSVPAPPPMLDKAQPPAPAPPPAIPAIGPSAAPSREEAVALQGLKELAAWYLPGGRPMEGVGDIVGFLQKLQDTLDVFLKCFVPLRDGYKQFETQMDIKKTARPGGAPTAAMAVETARDPRELAARLLDWNLDQNSEGPRAIESTFADLMIHQVAMLNGVMKGVKSLLAELSPGAIERALEDPKRKGGGGIQVGPFRYKALWELYAERHSDLADEEKEAFGLIFGPQFVQAYSQLAGEAVGTQRGGMPQSQYGPNAFPQGSGSYPQAQQQQQNPYGSGSYAHAGPKGPKSAPPGPAGPPFGQPPRR